MVGDRLPATRELAGVLGLNRTTVSAAYAVLEEAGLIEGQTGRGSFVARSVPLAGKAEAFDWNALLGVIPAPRQDSRSPIRISFSSSRPAQDLFPLSSFRKTCREVIDGPEASEILQLGSPFGYEPLRRHLLNKYRARETAHSADDLLVTNGCQQALDLLGHAMLADRTVLVEDPTYAGCLRVLRRTRARAIGVPIGEHGLDMDAFARLAKEHEARFAVVTPDFQNPTGLTLTLGQRQRLLDVAAIHNLVLIESVVYRDLRYRGEPLPSLKQLDTRGVVIQLGSFSKIAFPGLRVGWVLAPRPAITRLADAKQTSDIHSDQLSQAVLLRFSESGELDAHLRETCLAGEARLAAALDACERFLPAGSRFSRPLGGMNLWVQVPEPLRADELKSASEEHGVSFTTGNHFSVSQSRAGSLRLSFGGLSPRHIHEGIEIIGNCATELLLAHQEQLSFEPSAAVV